MPKRNPHTHSLDSVRAIEARIQGLLAQIQVSRSIMEMEPPLHEVEVEWQTALETAVARLRTWSDALRDAVDEKRFGLVSASPANGKKPRKTK